MIKLLILYLSAGAVFGAFWKWLYEQIGDHWYLDWLVYSIIAWPVYLALFVFGMVLGLIESMAEKNNKES